MRSFTFIFVLTVTVSLVYGWNGVFKFSIDDVKKSVIDYINLKVKEPIRETGNHKVKLGSWSYKNCGDPSTDLLVLSNLTLSPDPLSFPGKLDVSFKGVIRETVDAPLSGDVEIDRKVGSSWLKIPCFGNIGSCHYDDICDLLAGATCPDPFVTNNIPCKCPFTKGAYSLPTTEFDVLAAVLPPGDYRAQGNLTYSSKHVACVAITVTIV